MQAKNSIKRAAGFAAKRGASAALLGLCLAAGFAEGAPAVPSNTDLVIPISGVSATATFYPIDIDGVRLEVLAVKAPDNTIRTAFNTCQVCYASGRGYYKQQGTVLVCQNCGNRFRMSQVEVRSGGCNPVPIFAQNKRDDAENITIPLDFLRKAKTIFGNWRRG